MNRLVCFSILFLTFSHLVSESVQAEENDFAAEAHYELGLLTAHTPHVFSGTFIIRSQNLHLFANIGIPSLVNVGIGFSSEKDGSGINIRGSAGLFLVSASLTYKVRLSQNVAMDFGMGFLKTTFDTYRCDSNPLGAENTISNYFS